MEELIKITTREDGGQVISARELCIFLGIDMSHWKRWYNKNIEMNDYAIEGIDWTGFAIEANGNETRDFALSIDFAKRLSMMARTPRGEQARIYFVRMEKIALGSEIVVPKTFKEALKLALEQQELIEQQTNLIEAQTTYIEESKPKVEYAEKVLLGTGDLTTTLIASELGMSAIALNKKLKDAGIQRKHNGVWVLYSKYLNMGLTSTRTHPYVDSNGVHQNDILTTWTEEGRNFIHKLFNDKLK